MPVAGDDADYRPAVFAAHGDFDPVVPPSLGEQSVARLRELGFEVEWHRYPMAHRVCIEEIAAIREFLLARIR